MFKKINWKLSILTAVIASALFCICAFIFIVRADYINSWILYLGSALFFFTVCVSTVIDNRKRGGNESTVAMVFASHVSTVIGIIISIIVCSIFLFVLTPHALLSGQPEKILQENPPSSITGKSGGLVFTIYFAATVLYFLGGSIAGVTIPFYTKRNQTKDNKEPTPFKQKEAG